MLFFVVPRMLQRSAAAQPKVTGVVVDKRTVAPIGSSADPGARTRYQLLVDLDGGQHWTWCDADMFEKTKVGDPYVMVEQRNAASRRWGALRP